ncbi:MAG: M3 family metallopeptidase, partial [Burkholderiaceae bacterium]|nr:M3 family metallopeptidase [Burkholderiaceae bacterium]
MPTDDSSRADSGNANALLDFSGLPRFGDFSPALITPALDVLLAQARAAIALASEEATPASWEGFVEPLEDTSERLARAWGVVGHLNAVADTPELRAAYNENLPRVTQFWTEVGQNRELYAKYLALRESAAFAALAPGRRRAVELALQAFRLGGVELESPQRERFMELAERQAALGQKFSENVLDATDAYGLTIADAAHLEGVPQDVQQAARERAETDGEQGYKLTLQMPCYLPVMQYANDRALRETLYRAYSTRASELAAAPEEADRRAALDNARLIDELLALRHEEATLLGYDDFAQVSLVPKMADSPEQVIAFLRDLARRARPFAERDVAELRAFARDDLGLPSLDAWDFAWASEKLKEQRYSFSDQEVKRYFQLPRVLSGLFELVEGLFGVRISQDTAQTWHPQVSFHRIERDGALVGQFFLDLYARNGKRPGAWMDDARSRRLLPAGVQTPVAYLVCNFQGPVGGKPATLRHDDVITLFHEFGHGLHHMLTRVDDLPVSGIAGVEWDAVELPSQFMENFCWEWDNVRAMTAHIDTGEPLPRDLFERMLAAKNFQAGLGT